MASTRAEPAPLHVLRLASVFEPQAGPLDASAARFDPIGGMQNHTAALTRCLDALGVRQTVVTSRLAARPGRQQVGGRSVVRRVGLRTRRFRQLWALCGLPTALRTPRQPIDLVHAHQGEDLAVLPLGLLAARTHRCPLVVTLHCSVRHTLQGAGLRARLLRRLGGAVERAAVRRAAAVLVLVPSAARRLAEDGVPAAKIIVVPSGFEPAVFATATPDPFATMPRPRVGYVGRLAEQKAPELLVEAFGAVSAAASLVVVGDGPLRPAVQQAAARSAAHDRIHLFGFVPHEQIPSVLAGLDLLVLPSRYEEMGSVLVEAMASGLPVVASAVGGIPDVVADGVTGLLVPPADVDALAKAVDELVTDADRRRRMADAARQRAESYAWPALAQHVWVVYAAVTGR